MREKPKGLLFKCSGLNPSNHDFLDVEVLNVLFNPLCFSTSQTVKWEKLYLSCSIK